MYSMSDSSLGTNYDKQVFQNERLHYWQTSVPKWAFPLLTNKCSKMSVSIIDKQVFQMSVCIIDKQVFQNERLHYWLTSVPKWAFALFEP